MNRRGKIIRSSRLFSLGLPVENPGEGTKKREKGSWRWQEMGGEKGGRCREGMASEKGAEEEQERGKKKERDERRRGEVKQHAQRLE